ncbi:methyltransferase domain-containing protein [Leptospira sp. GIMC2001]|uniref:methyltransferase domain-containing protein n=1 Tax=Leptospira sp. GIMC2001 TaxID=1513297 RepID=UPI00234BB7FC|nr:methyltransferase domain-containing protein [Leptospira sp. GIMC2001]WCL48997.1 methyltransferase domain-containing protein [Leptospira sp. GIMC2001]
MTLTIKLAETEEEKYRVYALRYEVYIEELGRTQVHADHKNRLIKEPWDDTAHILYVQDDDKMVGTMRTNRKIDGPMEYEELYDLEKFAPFYPNDVSMTTRLLVRDSYRNSMAAGMMCLRAYEMHREWGINLNFIDTRPHLVRLYQQLGYRFYKENIHHPEFGNAIPLVIILNDYEYLKEVRSPFIRVAKRFTNSRDEANLFAEKFAKYSTVKPLFSMGHDVLWDTFTTQVNMDPLKVLTFLSGFDPEEAKKLLGQLDLLEFEVSDIVFERGDESEGMYCIMEGSVEVVIPGPKGDIILAILNQGEIFGELGFVSKIKRTATIKVREHSKILLLNQKEFVKLESNYPALALKLLTNLFSILVNRFNEKHEALMEARSMLDNLISGIGQSENEEGKENTMSEDKSKGSYVVHEFADSQAELDRLRFQAKAGFSLEKKMFKLFNINSESKVLDIGCGPAFFANEVFQEYKPKELHGIELDSNLISIAKREMGGVDGMRFTQGTVYDLPLEDAQYDLAYSRFVFQHLDDPTKGIKELKRVIKPGGTVIIEDIDDGLLFLEPPPASYDLVQGTSERMQKELGGDRRIGRKLHTLMNEVGFSKISIKYLAISSTKVGMEAFIFAGFGFKFDHLKRSGASDAEVNKAKEEFFALVKDPNAYGTLMLVFAVATV